MSVVENTFTFYDDLHVRVSGVSVVEKKTNNNKQTKHLTLYVDWHVYVSGVT